VPAVNVYTQMVPTLGHQTDVQYVRALPSPFSIPNIL
jgi:hypothetical protein